MFDKCVRCKRLRSKLKMKLKFNVYDTDKDYLELLKKKGIYEYAGVKVCIDCWEELVKLDNTTHFSYLIGKTLYDAIRICREKKIKEEGSYSRRLDFILHQFKQIEEPTK